MGSGSRRMRAFKRWMESQSIQYNNSLQLIEEQQQVYVKTTSDLHQGDVIATIPKQSCLTVKSSAAYTLIQDFCLEGYIALSVALMFEKSLAQHSPWFGYLQLLPDSNPDVPLLWSIHQIDRLLLGTELHKTVKEDKGLVYEDWKSCIVPFVESAPIQLNPLDFSVEHYFAAKSLISSRSFQIDDYYGFGMVPLADLFNHKTNAEDVHFTSVSDSDDDTNQHQIDDESNVASPIIVDHHASGILEMIMVRDVKAGAEVFNTYGSMGNAALLHRYGFTEPDNPYDIVNIDLELVLQWGSSVFSSRHSRSRISWWKRTSHSQIPTEPIEYFEILYDGEPEVELLKLIYIIALPEKAFNEFDKSKVATISIKKGIKLGEINDTNKRLLLTESVRGALLALADIRERCYGLRSMEDDVEALKSCSVADKKLYHSLVLRISERKILQKLRTYVSAVP